VSFGLGTVERLAGAFEGKRATDLLMTQGRQPKTNLSAFSGERFHPTEFSVYGVGCHEPGQKASLAGAGQRQRTASQAMA